MATSQLTPQQQKIAQMMFFSADPNQPLTPPEETTNAAPPAAQPSPSPVPSAPIASTSTMPGSISSGMGMTQPPMARDEYLSQHPAVMPPRPVSDFDGSKHAGLRRGLATAFAGLAEYGGDQEGQPGAGRRFVDRWNTQDAEQRAYDRNLPAVRNEAETKQYGQYLAEEQGRQSTRKTGVEADIAGQNMPIMEQAEKEYNDLVGHWQNKDVPNWDIYAQTKLQAMPPAIARRIAPLLDSIKKLPQTGKGYSLTMQDDLPKSIQVYGKELDRNDPNLPPGAGEDFDRAMAAHSTKRAEKVQDESTVAGYAASRQGAQIQAAMNSAQQAENNKTLNTGREQALKHLNDMRGAQNQLELVQQLSSSKSPTDQTSLAFKALGLDLPEGVHRINETELNAIRNQGSLSDRAYRAILNWTTGQQFAPDILQDISSTAAKIANSKVKNANDNLEDVNKVYGYKVAGSGPRGRLDEAPEAAGSDTLPSQAAKQLQEGHTTTFANGQKWTLAAGKPQKVK